MSLRYFYEDMPEMHLIAAGSLLGVHHAKDIISGRKGEHIKYDTYELSMNL